MQCVAFVVFMCSIYLSPWPPYRSMAVDEAPLAAWALKWSLASLKPRHSAWSRRNVELVPRCGEFHVVLPRQPLGFVKRSCPLRWSCDSPPPLACGPRCARACTSPLTNRSPRRFVLISRRCTLVARRKWLPSELQTRVSPCSRSTWRVWPSGCRLHSSCLRSHKHSPLGCGYSDRRH